MERQFFYVLRRYRKRSSPLQRGGKFDTYAGYDARL